MKRACHRLADIAARFGGNVLGDADALISQVATLESAASGDISFLTSARYRAQLDATRAGAVILGADDAQATQLPRIVCDNPYAYFAKVSAFLNPAPQHLPGVHASAVIGVGAHIDPSAHIGAHSVIAAGARIGAGCVIMNGCSIGADVHIGAHACLYPRVVVYHGCTLGERVIVHSGAVIGADGFGIAQEEGNWLKIPQVGRVVIGNDVEIGANTTIDRGALDDTVIEDGVKLDNQIQIAHNVRIGAHSAIAGCVGIAGSTSIGRHCRIGGSAGILGHLHIADHVQISSFTLIGKSIREAGSYSGIFPFSRNEEWRKNAVHLRHLDELADKIATLQREVAALKGKQS